MVKDIFRGMATKPCGELTAIENFAFTRYCERHLEEIKDLLTDINPDAVGINELTEPVTRKVVYGIQGIASIFNCSIGTAESIKKRGLIDEAITQVGRKIVTDVEKAKHLARVNGAQYGFKKFAKI